jgi:hypothetical protein
MLLGIENHDLPLSSYGRGWLLVAEVKSRFDPGNGGADPNKFIKALQSLGFSIVSKVILLNYQECYIFIVCCALFLSYFVYKVLLNRRMKSWSILLRDGEDEILEHITERWG